MIFHVQGIAYDEDADPFEIDEYVKAISKEDAATIALQKVEYQICSNEQQPIKYGWLEFSEDEPPYVSLSVREHLRYQEDVYEVLKERDELAKQVESLQEQLAELGAIIKELRPEPNPDFEPEF